MIDVVKCDEVVEVRYRGDDGDPGDGKRRV